jgi:hypothetical protein
MPTRIYTITALVLAGAAVAASPAIAAAMTAGNPGPAELTVDRAAPLVLPELTPKALPQVDRAQTRDLFDLDTERALASLGTVTLSSDGTVEEAPPSDGVRAAFEAAIKGSQGG